MPTGGTLFSPVYTSNLSCDCQSLLQNFALVLLEMTALTPIVICGVCFEQNDLTLGNLS